MRVDEFDREITRLRDHFGERHYSGELAKILWNEFGVMPLNNFRKIVLESIATHSQGRPPLRDDFIEISKRLDVRIEGRWKYFEVQDCMKCGGVGWHYVFRKDGVEASVVCGDCAAGRNLQSAPKPYIRHTMEKADKAMYSRPGKTHAHQELHPELKRKYGDWRGLKIAIEDGVLTIADFQGYLKKKLDSELGPEK